MNVIAAVVVFGERWWEMVIPAREMSISSGSGVPGAGGGILLKCRRYRRTESVWSAFMWSRIRARRASSLAEMGGEWTYGADPEELGDAIAERDLSLIGGNL